MHRGSNTKDQWNKSINPGPPGSFLVNYYPYSNYYEGRTMGSSSVVPERHRTQSAQDTSQSQASRSQ